MRPRLFTPGPTQIPEQVINAMSRPMQHHRSPEFKALFREVTAQLKAFFQTEHDVLILTSSGTGGMDACVVNLLRRGAKILTVEGGKFGQRWGEIGRAYGLNVISLKVEWGEAIDPNEVEAAVQENPDVAAVFLTHSETSTGVAFDVRAIAEKVRQHSDALVVVDGITSVGVLPFYKDEWHIDVCVSGSQKGVMIPPGLAFVALNDRAWQRAEQSDLPRYYLDFLHARKALKNDNTPWTPAITLMLGLHASLSMILDKGLEYFWDKYERLAYATPGRRPGHRTGAVCQTAQQRAHGHQSPAGHRWQAACGAAAHALRRDRGRRPGTSQRKNLSRGAHGLLRSSRYGGLRFGHGDGAARSRLAI
ncbi:MAG: alanine--glyoxylate aminotransferase family protein [candidate division KSB1 bacterium]|nr:alanine--glyoxylate aminotransferase family protein [candidate division KSB1 bacterium]